VHRNVHESNHNLLFLIHVPHEVDAFATLGEPPVGNARHV
jgi:hypothetical protein